MSTKKIIPIPLKHIFTRTQWQSDENKKARKADPTIEADGVEFEKIAIHFPEDFISRDLVEREFIRKQVVHGTRGIKRREDKSVIPNSRKEKPVEVYGYPVEGTNRHDIFQQLATYGLNLIDNEQSYTTKVDMIRSITHAKPLDRERPESKKKRVKGEKMELVTQIPIRVEKALFERVKAFQEEHKIKNRANIFYYLCLLALESFKEPSIEAVDIRITETPIIKPYDEYFNQLFA